MDAKLKADWVKALRSGEYRQAQFKLRNYRGGFCCIAVGYVISKGCVPDFRETFTAAQAIGLTAAETNALTILNDVDDKTFLQIADYIEANL